MRNQESFYGFDPGQWGCLGFSTMGHRDRFVRESKPGALVLIYGQKTKSPDPQRGKIIGILQVSHRVNHARAFLHPAAWTEKEADGESKGKWDLAVKATRAWCVVPESYVSVDDFAHNTYSARRAQFIGSHGMRLTPEKVMKLHDLVLIETSVFGEIPIDAASAIEGTQLLRASKPGPVSQNGYFTREAEGPKQLYVLRMKGNVDHCLGRAAGGRQIIKVGFSVSPCSRRDAFNAALPACAFEWVVQLSNDEEDRQPYLSSKHALAGEAAMKSVLSQRGEPLGGEFFLADESAVKLAWAAGTKAAMEYPSA